MALNPEKVVARLGMAIEDNKLAESMAMAGQSLLNQIQTKKYFEGVQHGLAIARVIVREMDGK